jgi:predicted protein tyrosine phosphatase
MDMKILVDSYWNLEARVQQSQPDAIISIMDNATLAPKLGFDPPRHLSLGFHDIEEPTEDRTPPSSDHLTRMINFAIHQRAAGARSILVHCMAGVRRSPAAAYIIAVAVRHEDPLRAAHVLFQKAPFVDPNRLMIKCADDLLGMNHAMSDSIAISKPLEQDHLQQHFFWI